MKKPIKVLLVEDNDADIVLALEAFKTTNFLNDISVVKDGQQALDFLYKRNVYLHVESPDLILLDINLPKIDGKEVLATMKQDDALRTIPVIVLSTSSAHKDILDAYYNHANCYITKPAAFEEFLDTIKKIESFWFSIAKIPSLN